MNPKELTKIIPYLASKFNHDLFKNMQIKLMVGPWSDSITSIDDYNLDKFSNILPKHIDISIIS
jgi:hypothetical protein